MYSMMTEEITNIQTDTPTKRPVGRPRKSNIPPPEVPPTTLEEYIVARNAYARCYYHANKITPPKEQCKFISLAGRQCPRTTNREYCSKHVHMTHCTFIDDEGKQCLHMTTQGFCRKHEAPSKTQCKFINLVGNQCTLLTNKEYCYRHTFKTLCIFVDDRGKQCPHMTTRDFCREHAH